MSQQIFLSLVIPVYNEVKRLPKGLEQAIKYLNQQKYTWELIIVDDGSVDDTYELAGKLIKGNNNHCRLLRHDKNQGKGAAIRTGVLAASGKYVVFSDIDFSTPVTQLPKLLESLKTHQVAIGVRRHKDSQVKVHQKPLREFLGQCFTKLTNLMATPGIIDATCGFKGYQDTAAKKIFRQMRIERWAFDAEILFLAIKYKYKIAQIPVVWSNNSATKVNMLHDGIRSFIDLLKIRMDDYGIEN